MSDSILIIICVFGAVGLLAFALTNYLLARGGDDRKIRGRLQKSDPATAGQAINAAHMGPGGLKPLLERVGKAAAQPFMPKTREKQSSIRQNLSRAGIYSPTAVKMLTGAKVIFLGGGLIGGYLVGATLGSAFLGLSLGGLIGYLAPTIWLRMAIKSNQKALSFGLADGLDLMVVCVEAGLTVDAAMQRVGQEVSLAHPALSRELSIAHMETRVGLSRGESLRNL